MNKFKVGDMVKVIAKTNWPHLKNNEVNIGYKGKIRHIGTFHVYFDTQLKLLAVNHTEYVVNIAHIDINDLTKLERAIWDI